MRSRRVNPVSSGSETRKPTVTSKYGGFYISFQILEISLVTRRDTRELAISSRLERYLENLRRDFI